MIGQTIPGRDLFSVLSPVAEIAATENVAATVLQKSMCLAKLENRLSLLLSAREASNNIQYFKESSIDGKGDLYNLR